MSISRWERSRWERTSRQRLVCGAEQKLRYRGGRGQSSSIVVCFGIVRSDAEGRDSRVRLDCFHRFLDGFDRQSSRWRPLVGNRFGWIQHVQIEMEIDPVDLDVLDPTRSEEHTSE